jgi:hypothetical protein
MGTVALLVIGLVGLVVVGAVMWRAFPSWKDGGQWGQARPLGDLPPEPEGFEKPRNEGDLL